MGSNVAVVGGLASQLPATHDHEGWKMRHLICLLAVTFPTYGFAQPGNADKVMADARAALGGEAKIAAVKTFVATGRTRQVRGENLVPIEFEIQAELPDKYSRYDEFPAQDAGPVTAGFVGDALVLDPTPVPPPPRPGGSRRHRRERRRRCCERA